MKFKTNYKDANNRKIIKGYSCAARNNMTSRCCGCIGRPCMQNPTGSQAFADPAIGFGLAYGTFIGTQPRVVKVNTPAPLDTVLSLPPVGIIFTPGSSTVTILNSGIYRITYMLTSNSTARYALLINGAILPNSTFSNSSGSSITGIATAALAAGSTLGIVSITETLLLKETNTVLDVLRIS